TGGAVAGSPVGLASSEQPGGARRTAVEAEAQKEPGAARGPAVHCTDTTEEVGTGAGIAASRVGSEPASCSVDVPAAVPCGGVAGGGGAWPGDDGPVTPRPGQFWRERGLPGKRIVLDP